MEKLQFLLSPVSVEDFFHNYYEKKYLLLQSRSPDYYSEILSVGDIDTFFQLENFPFNTIKIFNNGLNQGLSAVKGNRKDGIFQALRNGSSLLLESLQWSIPRLNQFLNLLSHQTTSSFSTNIYITPANAQAFKPHYDAHDVFVLQIHGTKVWKLYDTPVVLPDESQKKLHIKERDPEKLSKEFTIQPGDLLYMPRGLVHEALTTDSLSIHITLGMYPLRNIDLVKQIQKRFIGQAYFRQTVETIYGNAKHSVADQEKIFKKALLDEIAKADLKTLIANAKLQLFHNNITENYTNVFNSIAHREELTENTKIRKRKEVKWFIQKVNSFLQVHYNGKVAFFPPMLETMLKHALSGQEFEIKDLKGMKETKAKLKIVYKLIGLGILEIVGLKSNKA